MSCSTTSLSACTIKTTVTSEDPYIFTETTPTTPPILFKISQKSRNRVVVKQVKTTSAVKANKNQNPNKDKKFSKAKSHGAKTQTSSSISLKNAGLSTTAVLGVLNTNNIKYGPQSPKLQLELNQAKYTQQQQQQQQQQNLLLTQNENAATLSSSVRDDQATAVCVINNGRNMQQQQQQAKIQTQQKSQQQQIQQQSQTPPPLLLSHTPSLWQTPLILDDPKPMVSTTTAIPISTPTSTISATSSTFVSALNHTPIKISFQSSTALPATALMPPINAFSEVTTGTSTISAAATITTRGTTPLHLLMQSASPLPPSNFHSTTLAQHLQKVQCLKKSKKLNSSTDPNNTIISNNVHLLSKSSSITDLKSITENKNQHSTSDFNEIPVNVIFRSPTKVNNFESNSHHNDSPSNGVSNRNKIPKKRQTCTYNIKGLANESPNVEKTIGKKFIGLASDQSAKQSSKHIQKRKTSSRKSDGQPSQPKICKLQKTAEKSFNNCDLKKLTKNEKLSNISNECSADLVVIKPNIDSLGAVKPLQKIDSKRKTSGIALQKTPKRNYKVKFASRLNADNPDQSEILMTGDFLSSSKAFAIVRIPYKQIEHDISQLAEDSVLPYCVQRHWFNANESLIRSSIVKREERIIENKNLFRRQAMQLLATRSLQQLPFHIARKRLICVDNLLRKYRDHNKTVVIETTNKQCEVQNCVNLVLQMSTFCPQHIVKNTKQSIFVQCGGKKLKDNQKPCDVPVLNIQKPYSAPLCFGHANRYQYDCTYVNKIARSSHLSAPVKSNQKFAIQKNSSNRRRKTTNMSTNNKITSYLSNGNIANVILSNANATRFMDTPSLRGESSLESIMCSSHSSFASSMQAGLGIERLISSDNYKQKILNGIQTNMLSPPSLAPLSNNRNHIHSNSNFGSHYNSSTHRENSLFGNSTLDPTTAEQEINKLVAQFAMAAAASVAPTNNTSNSNCNGNNNKNYNNYNNNNNKNSFNYMNTNSNSNMTSSGVGSSSSLPSTDELLTQDMLSICENSSAYASSSEDTGLGVELSENELVGANGGNDGAGCGSGFNDDDVSPDEIPLGDTRLLEETDLVNVFGTLPVNLNELFTAVVRQDEREEVERALEMADKHLKTLQETLVSDTDFLADFLNVNDDMLADTDDICSKMEIHSSVLSPPDSDAATMYLESSDSVLNASQHASKNDAISGNCVSSGNVQNGGIIDIRGLLQT